MFVWAFIDKLFALGFATGRDGELFKGWGGFSIGAKLGAWSGVGLLVMMFIAGFDNSNNPVIDDHIVDALAGVGIVYTELKYQAIRLGGWWRKLPLVQK